ncbi:MAG: Zn-dependent hydrolase [Herpetosiphonaceae bacterium]|nr:MAG: Zn-dependent hydrolase [Herpetosiphonaceae bacterium]
MKTLTIDTDRLLRDLDTLATFTEPGTTGWTRRAFSPAFIAARAWLAKRMQDAGLSVSVDAAGNLIGRRPGLVDMPSLMIGSHTDTVPGAGRFDGMLGVLAGIAVARALDQAGVQLHYPLEIVDFLAEEPTPFGLSCIGSMGMAGVLDERELARQDSSGRTLAEALQAVGGRPDDLGSAIRKRGDIAAYLELHIEQGRVLEEQGAPLGVVQGIVGIRRAMLQFAGRPDHAGTTPMGLRHDALAAAAEVILAAERMAYAAGAAVATVGRLAISPNQENVVPGSVEMSLEVRSLNWGTVERVWAGIESEARTACSSRGVELIAGDLHDVAPMHTPDWLLEIIARACGEVATDPPLLPSGAGHDASWIGRIAPAGMIFVRSKDGRSHCPEEYSAPEDIALGANALGAALLALDHYLDLTLDLYLDR